MAKKSNSVGCRLNDRSKEALDEFVEKHETNQADAIRTVLKDRLIAEGHLEGMRADGGIPAEDLEQTQSLIQSQTLLTVAGFVFVAAELSVGLPDWFVIVGGLLILAALTGFNLRRYGYV
mgnify:CR=1 FL=1